MFGENKLQIKCENNGNLQMPIYPKNPSNPPKKQKGVPVFKTLKRNCDALPEGTKGFPPVYLNRIMVWIPWMEAI